MNSLFCTCLRSVARIGGSTSRTVTRSIHASTRSRAAALAVPEKRDSLETPADFLTRIGRSMSEHEGKVGETWEDLWAKDSEALKKAGVTQPKDRKYILRQMTYFRQGRSLQEIKAKPKKLYRGRGPRVQKGKRIR